MTDQQASPEAPERDAANRAALVALIGTGEPESPDDTQQHNDNDALAALLGKQGTPA